MLTLAKVATGASAASYYESSNDYYNNSQDPSQWQGDGARRLGLSGEVDPETFRKLLDGELPDGSRVHNAAAGRLGGIDFTLSAPKSVSMQALIGGDSTLIAAHEKAVARTMRYAEGLATYRTTDLGVTQRESSANLIIAKFRHDLSRARDPNLHTHAVVLNATQRPDGEWRALHHIEFFKQKMLMGALYRAELAQEIQKLGYRIRITHADGRFELAHMNSNQIEAFSTRSKDIENSLAAKGKTREQSSAKEKQLANLTTRAAKTEVDKKLLHQHWQELSQANGVNYNPAMTPKELGVEEREAGARTAISYALEHATERQSVVSRPTVLRHALEHGTGVTDLEAIRTELARAVSQEDLIVRGDQCTTQKAQQRERELLDVATRGRGAVSEILDQESAVASLNAAALTDGQKAAATLILSTQDRVIAIQGAAGSGKTTMLRHASGLAQARDFKLCGVAPSAAAARELSKTGIQSQTIASFVGAGGRGLNDRSLLIVDEAGMVSAKDMHSLLEVVEAANARVVLVGDVQQLKAVEAGRPFAQLQESWVTRVEMGEIQRQSDARLRQAVELAYSGYTQQSIALLGRNVVEIPDTVERHASIARDYARLDPAARADTLIVSGTRRDVASINQAVREALQLAGRGIVVSTKVRHDLSKAQAKMSVSYRPGDIIEAKKTFRSLGMGPGDLARVVEASNGKVVLQRADGVHVQWRPAIQTNMVAYNEVSREISIGDRVRFTDNDHSNSLMNGDRATVVAVDTINNTVKLRTPNGKSIELHASAPLALDYAYCSTVHAAQGGTCRSVLIDANTMSATSHESSFYTAISRARENATVYTDDKDALPHSMAREDVKHAALDLQSGARENDLER